MIPKPPQTFPSAAAVPSEKEIWDAFIGARYERPKFLVEKLGEKSEPCMNLPMAGPIRRVATRFKCTIYFDERIRGEIKQGVEVVYIEKGHIVCCKELDHEPGRTPKSP